MADGRVNILLIDDDKDKIFALESILEDLDLNLIKCTSGEEGLKQVLEKDFAAILLDVNMPGLSGFETAKMIRQRPKSSHIPIIFITAYSTAEIDVRKGYSLGAVDYIFSPVIPEVLKAKVQAFVDLNNKTKKIQQQNDELELLRGHLEELISERTAALEEEIAERKKVEKRIKESLAEKEILLAEIHHRVKNNMAVISGLLEMEMGKLKQQGLKDVLLNSKSRIKSMAMVHEKLYESMQFTHVEFGNYLLDLVDMVSASFSSDIKDVDIQIRNNDNVILNVNQAIPFALLLNELFNNAFKHAFDETNKGRIIIDFTNVDDERIDFRIEDNGIGLPDEFDLNESETLGMKLIRTLVKQLKGTVEIEKKNGTVFKISFPKKEKRGSSCSHLYKKKLSNF